MAHRDIQTNSAPKVEQLPLHQQAEETVKDLASDYAASLVLQARVLATQQEMDEVQRIHIEDAHDLLFRDQRKSRSKELLLVFGSALVGAFIQGFITELNAGHKWLTAIYVLLGFVGMLLVFRALLKR